MAQTTTGAVPPLGESRPAWKVLRVLGNLFEADGFDYITSADVSSEIGWSPDLVSLEAERPAAPAPVDSGETGSGLARIADAPLYRVDGLVRRASSLQRTGDNPPPMAQLCGEEARRIGVAEGDRVSVAGADSEVSLEVRINEAVPTGSVYVPSAWEATAPLGDAVFLTLSRV